MRLLVSIVVLLLAFDAPAAVYKCKNANGAIEFKDQPCAPGTGGEIAVKGIAPADQGSDGKAAAGAAALTGAWCEYAVSMDEDSEKDDTSPANWNFSGDTLEYRMKRGGTIKARIVRSETGIAIDNQMLGGINREWDVVSVSGGKALLRGPLGGYFHFRRGSCP